MRALRVALAWVLRRLQFARGGGGPVLGVVAQVPLGPRDRVVLLRIGDRQAVEAMAARYYHFCDLWKTSAKERVA